MSYSNWGSNAKISGGALIVKLTHDNSILFTCFKQIANNPDKKGNFDFKAPINIKFSDDEAADIIRAIRTNGESKFYHKFKEEITSGSFRFYTVAAVGDKPARSGFGFSVTKGDNKIQVGFSLAAAERFSEYLKFVLNKIFESGFIDDVAKDVEFFKNRAKEKAGTKETNAGKVETQQETPAIPEVDF
jgi:hypothetical protein